MKFKNVYKVEIHYDLVEIFCDSIKGIVEHYFLNRITNEIVAYFADYKLYDIDIIYSNKNDAYIFKLNLPKENSRIVKVIPQRKLDIHLIEDPSKFLTLERDVSYHDLFSAKDCKYDNWYKNEALAMKRKGSLWGFIDINGDEFIEPQYEDYQPFSNGYAWVKKNGKWGCINKQNEEIIPFMYELPSNEGIAFYKNINNKIISRIMKNNKWGVVDIENNIILPFKYDELLECYHNFIILENNEWEFIDDKENIILRDSFEEIDEIYYPILIVSKNDLYGIVDNEEQRLIIPCEYKKISVMSILKNGDTTILFAAKKFNNKDVILSVDNKEISSEFDEISDFSFDSLFKVKNNEKYGYINESGEIVIPLKFYDAEVFSNGLAKVQNKDLSVNIINTNDEILYTTFDKDKVFNLSNGCVLAETQNNEFEIIRLTEYQEYQEEE